jgi:hypothetical protein
VYCKSPTPLIHQPSPDGNGSGSEPVGDIQFDAFLLSWTSNSLIFQLVIFVIMQTCYHNTRLSYLPDGDIHYNAALLS